MWNVYSADHHLVATYSTEQAAACHVASWPALFYTQVVAPSAPTVPESGADSPPVRHTRTKSDG